MASILDKLNLPDMDDARRLRPVKQKHETPTRLQDKTAAKKLTTVNDAQFKASVWRRDRNRCRCCGRKVLKTITRTAERGEVHHLHGRVGDLRHETKAAILVCCACHEQLTGKVNAKLVPVATKEFVISQGRFIDATFPLTFKKVI